MKWDNVIGLPKSITFGFHAARMRDFDVGNKRAARFLELFENARDLHSFTSVKFYFTILFRILHPVTADSHRCSHRLL